MIAAMTRCVEHPRYAQLMLLAVMGYAFTKIALPDIGRLCQVLFSVGMLGALCVEFKRLIRDPMVIMMGLALLLQLASWVNSLIYLPNMAHDIPKLDHLTRLFTFIAVAYWLRGQVRNVYWLWGIFLAGFVFTCLNHSNIWEQFQWGLHGRRVDFGLRNAQHASMFAGIGFIMSTYFGVHVLMKLRAGYRHVILVAGLALLVAASAFGVLVLITQSRQVWLALLVVCFLAPWVVGLMKRLLQAKYLLLSYALLSIAAASLFSAPVVEDRLNADLETFDTMLSGDFSALPSTSVGIRINSWLAAGHWFWAHPIIGNGIIAKKLVITESDSMPAWVKERFSHLHNFHLEVLVAYGILGLILVYAIYVWAIHSLIKMRRRTQNPALDDVLCMAILFTIYWFVVNSFESFNAYSTGVLAHNIMLGGAYSFYLHRKRKGAVTKSSDNHEVALGN